MVLALMQNQWFKDPERIRKLYERSPSPRHLLIQRFLFAGCLSGKRLQTAFGTDLCRRIIWEEASPEIGGHSSSRFKPDAEHIANALRKHRPNVVVLFGAVARQGFAQADLNLRFAGEKDICPRRIVKTCHPAARGTETFRELDRAANELRKILKEMS